MIPVITHDSLRLPGIVHGFFTRAGGVSTGLYASLNCGIGSHDARERVMENRARVCTALGVAADRLATPYQVHGTKAVVLETPGRPARDRKRTPWSPITQASRSASAPPTAVGSFSPTQRQG